MQREERFTFRTNKQERQLIALVAKRLERSESDAMRVLVRNVAQELGVRTAATNDRKTDASGKRAA